MTAVRTSYGTGYSPTAPAEFQTYLHRVTYRPDGTRTPLVFCHGYGGHAYDAFTGPGNVAMPAMLRHLARCGWPVVFPDLAGDTWGNDTGNSRITDAKNYLQTSKGAKTGPAVIIGYSEGGLDAMNYARAFPGNVKALVLFNPASDLTTAWQNNTLGSTASINAAYGGAYNPATDGPVRNPVQMAGQLAGIPTLIHNSSTDPYVSPSSVTTVVGLIGTSCTRILTSGDHGDGSLSLIDRDRVAAWLSAQGA